jgi:hypothetical protein
MIANMSSPQAQSSARQFLLSGVDRSQTWQTLALAVGLGIGTALLRLYYPNPFGLGLSIGVLGAFTFEASWGAILYGRSVGVFTMGGLAAIHAYLNEGYVPSLLVAALPSYGAYLFYGPPPGVVRPVSAATYVLPFAITAGTIGFLIGFGARWARGRATLPVQKGLL